MHPVSLNDMHRLLSRRDLAAVPLLAVSLTLGFSATHSLANDLSASSAKPVEITTTGNHEKSDMRRLRQALGQQDIETANVILEGLEHSGSAKILFEIAQIRFDKNQPFYNPDTGISLVKRIVSQNSSLKGEAAFAVGKYYKFSPIPLEENLSIEWFEKAASFGVERAHVQLGDIYSRSTGAARDLTAALHHYQVAAENVSSAPIMSFARKIQGLGSEAEDCGIDPSKLAETYLPILRMEAAFGKIAASKELGRLYLKGIFVEQNFEQASKWLHLAAQAGDPGAMRDLAVIQLDKPLTPNSHEKASNLLKLSAKNGNGSAYATLAKLHLIKNNPAADEKAFKYYQKSVEAGFYGGLRELKNIYQGEKLLDQDPSRIQRLAQAITKIEQSIGGYFLPDRTNTSEEGQQIAASFNQVDNIVVGSIENASVSPSNPQTQENICKLADEIDANFLISIGNQRQ